MKNNENKEKNIYVKYGSYVKLRDASTRPFLMISELIDNAISSFDNEYGKDKWGKKLTVDIEFHYDDKNSKKIFDTLIEPNSYIKVKDNAFGMSYKKLGESIDLDKINEDSDSDMNRHGRGMKQCAFYFGLDLTIDSWFGDEINRLNFKSSDKKYNDKAAFTIEKISKEETELINSGTLIKIENIYANKVLSSAKFESLKRAVSYRYVKLVEDKKMEIRYSKNFTDESEEMIPYVGGEEPIVKVSKVFNIEDKNKINNILLNSEEDIKNAMNGKSEEKGLKDFPKYKDLVKQTFENIKNLILNAEEDDLFYWSQKVIINKKTLDVDFWYLEKNNKRFRGFRAYEGNRALMHPPMFDDEDDGAETFHKGVLPGGSKKGSTDNRFAGSFDILQINASTKTDKSKFTFESTKDEEDLVGKLSIIWEVFNIVATRGRYETKDTEGKNIDSKEAREIKSALDSKMSKMVKDVVINGNSISMKIASDDISSGWNLEINNITTSGAKNIWEINDIDNENKLFSINAYSGNLIWQRIQESNKFLSEMFVPITVLVSYFEIINYLSFGIDSSDMFKYNSEFENVDFNKIKEIDPNWHNTPNSFIFAFGKITENKIDE